MAYYCKPAGGYSAGSTEGTGNIWQMHYALDSAGYTIEAQCGVIGNSMAEGGLNPWRWQSDTVNYGAGYGLFQFTPANGYIGPMSWVTGYGPNLSVTQVSGGLVTDGDAQMYCLINDSLSKWVSYCWRDYWSIGDYPALWALRTSILNTWGNGSTLTQAQFKNINDIQSATFAFMACYEGQLYPGDFSTRVSYANTVYSILTGSPPPDPPPDPPIPPTPGSNLPIWLLFKLKEANS